MLFQDCSFTHTHCHTKVSILINSIFFVTVLSYVLEYRNNMVWWVQYHDVYGIGTWRHQYTPVI